MASVDFHTFVASGKNVCVVCWIHSCPVLVFSAGNEGVSLEGFDPAPKKQVVERQEGRGDGQHQGEHFKLEQGLWAGRGWGWEA